MNFTEVTENARGKIGPYCKACPVCNGVACKNHIPGPGAKGVGDVAIRNYKKWQEVRVNMDTLCAQEDTSTELELFGQTFTYPIFAAPVGSVKMHYGEQFTDETYDQILVEACAQNGIAAFVGDGPNPAVMAAATDAVKQAGGIGVPTIKPWDMGTVQEKMKLAQDSNAFAIAMDIDAAGLPFLQNQNPPAGSKSVAQLKEIAAMTDKPFIVKGIMTPKAALKALEAGAAGIVVSNHGGRVLDQCLSTAEVLPGIVEAVGGKMKIFVDGGLRNGVDIFKALAMGADAVMLARPFVTAMYGGEKEGVEALVQKLGGELLDTMKMCGASSLSAINKDMISLSELG